MKKYLLVIIALCIQTTLLAQKKYSFRGKLGQNIVFRLDLEQNKDGIIAGETTYYRKNGQIAKLPVYGWKKSAQEQGYYDGDALFLTEYDGIKQCGYFSLGINSQGMPEEGTWRYLEKELTMNSVEKTIFPTGVTYFHPAKGAAINGEYGFRYSRGEGFNDCGGTTTLTYHKNGKLHYFVCTVTPNIAEVEKAALLNGSYFSGSHGDYRYKAYIDRNFVCIWATQWGVVDDWGANAAIDGFFIRK